VNFFRGNAVFFVDPGAQVAKSATFGTEGTGGVPVPFNSLLADGATNQHATNLIDLELTTKELTFLSCLDPREEGLRFLDNGSRRKQAPGKGIFTVCPRGAETGKGLPGGSR